MISEQFSGLSKEEAAELVKSYAPEKLSTFNFFGNSKSHLCEGILVVDIITLMILFGS